MAEPGVPSDMVPSRGDLARRQNDLESEIGAARTAKRGQAMSIGKGGIRVHSGGSVTVEGGGDVGVHDGGTLYAAYPSGAQGVKFGPLIRVDTGEDDGYGLLVQTDGETIADRLDVFRAKSDLGVREVVIGQTPASEGAVDTFWTAAQDVTHHAYTSMRLESHDGSDLLLVTSGGGGVLKLQSSDNGDIEILSDERLWLYGNDDVDVNCPNGAATITAGSDVNVVPAGEFDVDAGTSASVISGTTMYLEGGTQAQLLSFGGPVAIGGSTGTYIQPESTGLAANVHMAADGRVYRSTSTRRYKRDIQDLEVDPGAVLQLKPRSWLPGAVPRSCPAWMHDAHDDGDCPADQGLADPPPGARRQVGFVAEELIELGLGDFVEFNADGQPEAIFYDRLAAALIPLMQRQQSQIDALTARLDALEAQ